MRHTRYRGITFATFVVGAGKDRVYAMLLSGTIGFVAAQVQGISYKHFSGGTVFQGVGVPRSVIAFLSSLGLCFFYCED